MKIVVFAYDLVFAGVTVNAIEMAATLRDAHAHEVVLFAAPGPMLDLVREKGLRFSPAPPAPTYLHPSPGRMLALRDLVRRERPDLLYVWSWVQCLDSYYVEHLVMGVPILVTDMTMDVQKILPKWLPTTFGTPQLRDLARAKGYRRAEVLLPPIDVHLNAPEAVDPRPFRQQTALRDDELVLVTVSRLDTSMKAEGIHRTIDAVSALAASAPVRFVLVGDGDARADIAHHAALANDAAGREIVTLTGPLLDPRPAYAAADVVIGMGSSALRGMAFAKPVLIVGERGFSALFDEQTADTFHYVGMYGVGDGDGDNHRLIANLHALVERPDRLEGLGAFSRRFVLSHFALEAVVARLDELCLSTAKRRRHLRIAAADGLRSVGVIVKERRFLPPGLERSLSQLRRRDFGGGVPVR